MKARNNTVILNNEIVPGRLPVLQINIAIVRSHNINECVTVQLECFFFFLNHFDPLHRGECIERTMCDA